MDQIASLVDMVNQVMATNYTQGVREIPMLTRYQGISQGFNSIIKFVAQHYGQEAKQYYNKRTQQDAELIKVQDQAHEEIITCLESSLCNKDIMSYRSKKKSAFYNCFVVILRIKFNDIHKEVHMKVFNTGKLEIPGIQSDDFLHLALTNLVNILRSFCGTDLAYNKENIDTVLINSNFTCNYYIDRDKLSTLLKYKYKLHVNYDPCSYPGIQVKFYYNAEKKHQDGVCLCKQRCDKKGSGKGDNQCLEISFMIFRTGSVLIVGHCDVFILHKVYDFLKNILQVDYIDFRIQTPFVSKKTDKKKKVRKKTIIVDVKAN